MYINQQKWLELRATRRSSLISCLCNNINIVSWMIQFSLKKKLETRMEAWRSKWEAQTAKFLLSQCYSIRIAYINWQFFYVLLLPMLHNSHSNNLTLCCVLCYVYSRLHFMRWIFLFMCFTFIVTYCRIFFYFVYVCTNLTCINVCLYVCIH